MAKRNDVWSYNTAIAQGIKAGNVRYKDSLGMLAAMKAEGIEPNTGTYGAIMDAALAGGREDRQTSVDALALFEEIPKELRSNHVC